MVFGSGMLDNSQSLDYWLTMDRSQLYLRGLQPEKDGRAGLSLEELMRNAGFENVESRMMQLPLCGWPDGLSRRYCYGGVNILTRLESRCAGERGWDCKS